MRSERGQASIEWTALVAVVVVLMLVAGTVVAANPGGIVNAVVGGLRHALCVVSGGSCETPALRACTVRTRSTGARVGVDLAVVSIGSGAYVLTEERSDGTVAVSLLDAQDVAAAFGLGASGRLEVGRSVRVSAGVSAQLELASKLTNRRTWELPDASSARAFARRLARLTAYEHAVHVPVVGRATLLAEAVTGRVRPDVPEPDRVAVEAGAEATAGLEVTGGSQVGAGIATTLGGSRDRRTGARTLSFRLHGEGAGAIRGALLEGPSAEGEGDVGLVVDYDPTGRPVAVTLLGSGAGLRVPGVPEPPRGARDGEGRLTASSQLALDTPQRRAAYERVMRGLSPSGVGDLPAAARELAALLRREGRLEVVRYADDRVAYGTDGSVTVGGRIGVGGEGSQDTSRLLDAWTRPPGGIWEQRLDCLAASRS